MLIIILAEWHRKLDRQEAAALEGWRTAAEGFVAIWRYAQEGLAMLFSDIGIGWALLILDVTAMLTGGVEAWKGVFTKAKTILSTLWDNIIAAIKTAIDIDWSAIGRGIIDGIKLGISGAASRLAQAAAQAAADALNAAKAFLGIQSPSKRAAVRIGKPFMEGIGVGLVKYAHLPQQSLSKSMDRLMRSAFVPGAAVGMSAPAVAGVAMPTRTGGGGIAVIVQGDVWSDRKVDEIANAIDRRLRMRGVRRF